MTVMLNPGDLPGVADGIGNAADQLTQAPGLTTTQATGFLESRALSNGLKIVSRYLDQWHADVVATVRYRAALVDVAGKWFAQHDNATADELRKLADQALKQSSADNPSPPANPPAH
jgi:hypothetical protein